MIRSKIAIVMFSAAALCVCAVAVTNSATADTQKGTIWEECLKNPTNKTVTQYTDATCATAGNGGYYWSPTTTIHLKKLKNTAKSPTVLKATIAGVTVEIQCTTDSGEGEAEETVVEESPEIRIAELALTYEECSVTKPAGKGCTVAGGTFTTGSLVGETVPGATKIKYVPASGTTIATITIEGASCPVKGAKPLTGSETAVYEAEGAEEEFTEASGSELKLAGQAATLTGDKYKWCTSDTGILGRLVQH